MGELTDAADWRPVISCGTGGGRAAGAEHYLNIAQFCIFDAATGWVNWLAYRFSDTFAIQSAQSCFELNETYLTITYLLQNLHENKSLAECTTN